MKKLFLVFMLFGVMPSIHCAAPASTHCEFTAEKAPSPACIDLLLKVEYVIANLASDTYELIDLQRTTQYHPHLEFSKSQRKILDALDTFFYRDGNYDALIRTFKFNKEKGIDAAIAFFHKIADLIDISLPSSSGLTSNEQKLEWLKGAAKPIKKQYKSFKPNLKSDELTSSIKKAIIFNPVTRHLPLAELAKALTSQYARVIETGVALYLKSKYGKKDSSTKDIVRDVAIRRATKEAAEAGKTETEIYHEAEEARKRVEAAATGTETSDKDKSLVGTIFSRENLDSAFISLGIQAVNEMLNQYLTSLAETKKKYEERERFTRTSKEQKEIKKQLHSMVSHAGTGEGFSMIRGIQDDKTIKDLTFFADWLKRPISYSGSKLAMMLYGEPGNGKGIITKALSDESKTPMITISADDVAKRQIATKLWAATQLAQGRDQKSVIVFFDEIDLIVPQKDKAALQAFLTFLDGTQKTNPHVRVLYIFATNHIEKLDPRMLRPGRFKAKIYVGPPNQAQRAKLIEMSLLETFKAAPAALVEQLAAATDGLSRVAIDEAIENTYNHAALTEETPDVQSFLEEIEKLKEITYHSTKQIA